METGFLPVFLFETKFSLSELVLLNTIKVCYKFAPLLSETPLRP